MRYPGAVGRVRDLALGTATALRRRRQSRTPRVRVRIAHGEASVLSKDSPHAERIMSLASELAAEYDKPGRGGG
jgi:hypothetical protein